MPTRTVLILEKRGGPWAPFLGDYLSDVSAAISVVEEPSQAAAFFDRLLPSLVFAEPPFLNKALLQKLRVRKNTDPAFRAFLLGEDPAFSKDALFSAVFPATPSAVDLDKRFVETLLMPETLRLLVVDDEEEIGSMVRDYFEGRKAPAFEIAYAANGREALEAIGRKQSDVILLDIKMPVMDGREFYEKLRAQNPGIPVIVFFDSISGEELSAMRRFGHPAVIEKGFKGSSLPAMMALVKRMVYFNQ